MKRYALLVISILFFCSLSFAEERSHKKIEKITPRLGIRQVVPYWALKEDPLNTPDLSRVKCSVAKKARRKRISHFVYTVKVDHWCTDWGFEEVETTIVPARGAILVQLKPFASTQIECFGVTKRGRRTKTNVSGWASGTDELIWEKYGEDYRPSQCR